MLKMRLYRRYFKFNYILTITAITFIIYMELITYYLNVNNWHKLKCENRNQCLNVLLVADPQIIGIHNEIIHFLTPLSVLDSDSYLKKTYSYAYDFVKPDVVIFLGDLMDEGHTANDEEFYGYARRLFNIFLNKPQGTVRHIWLPGDNDIGGEDTKVTPEKIQRFENVFSQPNLIQINNTVFFKVNRLIESIPIFKEPREFEDRNKIFVALSHVPLMFKPSKFVDKVITKMWPHILFTAHDHKSMIISTNALLREEFHVISITPESNNVFEYELGFSDMYEFMIPTCSYRMGTTKIGFGYAVLENGEIRYTVLWSPSRFHQLVNYLIILAVCVLIGLYHFYRYCIDRHNTKYKVRFNR